jgi:hypothetical protein
MKHALRTAVQHTATNTIISPRPCNQFHDSETPSSSRSHRILSCHSFFSRPLYLDPCHKYGLPRLLAGTHSQAGNPICTSI